MKIADVILVALLLAGSSAKAQFVNTGQILFVGDSGLLYVDADYLHHSGKVLNKGIMVANKDWSNEDSNSSVFTSESTGEVQLNGADQVIGGQFKTTFPNLSLSGIDYKKLETDADVAGQLFLNDREFRAEGYTLSVLSSDPEAIQRTSGFISTDKSGKLLRNLNSPGAYLFPLGSYIKASGINLYRPVKVTAKNSSSNTFSLSLLPEDPGLSGYDRESKKEDVKNISDKYFYRVSQNSGNSGADFKFFKSTVEDGNEDQVVVWNALSIWEKETCKSTDGMFGDGLDRYIAYHNTDVLQNTPISFATSEQTVAANEDISIYNAFSPDGDNKNDTWKIKNIDLYPENSLVIVNRWGDEVYKATGYTNNRAWDGGNLASGTYFYALDVNVMGKKKIYKGFITLIKRD